MGMDKKQFETVAEMVRCAASVEGMCDNLKKRLKLAASELKGQKEWKPVADAAAGLLKPVEAAYAEIQKVLKIPQKEILGMDPTTYKKKAEKMNALIASASTSAAAYWGAYKKAYGNDPKIGACISTNASSGYAEQLIKFATDTKIAYNRIK